MSVIINIMVTAAFKQTMLNAKSIAYSFGPSGVYLMGLLKRMGISDVIAPRCQQIKGTPVGAVVARGDAEIRSKGMEPA